MLMHMATARPVSDTAGRFSSPRTNPTGCHAIKGVLEMERKFTLNGYFTFEVKEDQAIFIVRRETATPSEILWPSATAGPGLPAFSTHIS